MRKPKKVKVYRYLRKLKLQIWAVETQVAYHFKNNYHFAHNLSSIALFNTACRYAATKLINYAIEQRQEQVTEFFKAIYKVKNSLISYFFHFYCITNIITMNTNPYQKFPACTHAL